MAAAAAAAATAGVAAENHICRACLLAATHVRSSHASYALRSFNIGKIEARSDLNRNSAMQDGQVRSARGSGGRSGLRRRRHCGCGNCGSGLSNTHAASIGVDVVADADATSVE